ncbi:prepilin-type N-terminal cleavage/methylation domain-containing protein [Dyella kyungheensis]|uniref:Prepilin-type N-terminal cleavage/methylation domain-containing protein n=1 Tax=Dyella kyungheensis TaxID=1242174 RepID=A0ABS2JWM9_9GAMM|nr:prepilin-type N-terminal cleavage/methylation domain-containing protein [Dyella kyungheensis]MBM7123426.1 prepilin-type N-terminal cleavage/methylation domain-containing protein [Dyella kyungheensis]
MTRHARGFSLLEVIAAILLLALAFAALLHVAGASLHLADQSGQISRADMWAQAKLDALGVAEPLVVGESDGDFGKDYRWHLRVAPWQDDTLPADSPLALYRVDLDVRWGSKRRPHTLRYTTLRAIEEPVSLVRSAR